MAKKILKRINSSEQSLQKVVQEAMDEKKIIDVLISTIKEPKYHDRRYVDKHALYELSQSINATNGLISPAVLRELSDGSYERLAGYRRIEAYKILEKEKIPSIILKNVSDKQALLFMTTENMQRENLSLYDETLALLDYVAVSLETTPEETEKLLNRFKNFKSGAISGMSNREKEKYFKVEEILSKTGKISISTLINRLKKTKVHPLLKKVLSEGGITFAVAQILNGIENEEDLQRAIDETIKQNFSKRELVQHIKQLLPVTKSEETFLLKTKKINRINLKRLSEKRQREINRLIDKILTLAN